jgi:hypothetical protein
MAKEKLLRPTKVGDRVSTLATDIHSDSECNRRYGGLAKTQRVYGIVRHIEKVLKPRNKVKTMQVTACSDFGENSLGIRDFKMVTLNEKRCLIEPSLESAAVLAVAHARLWNQLGHLHPQVLLQPIVCLLLLQTVCRQQIKPNCL